MAKLYYHPLSSYCQKVLFAFYEKGLEFEPEIVDLFDPAQVEEYRKLYPLGKIPLLMDGDRMVPESPIIIEYIENHHDTGTKLIPDDPHESRRTRFADRMHDLYLNDSVSNLIFQSWKLEEERDQALIEKCRYRIEVCYGYMEHHLGEHQWAMTENFTMADCSAAPPLFYARQVAPFDDRPNISAYWERLCVRPAWQRVMEEAKPYLEKLEQTHAA